MAQIVPRPPTPTDLRPTAPYNRRLPHTQIPLIARVANPPVGVVHALEFRIRNVHGQESEHQTAFWPRREPGQYNPSWDLSLWLNINPHLNIDGQFSFQVRALARDDGGGYLRQASDWSNWATFWVHTFPPLAPINLLPTTQQNRLGPIALSWQHNPRPASETNNIVDPQVASQIEYWQGTEARTSQMIMGAVNTFTIPANTFTTDAAVNFRARTQGGNGAGWGPWSAQASFPLIVIAPPQAPIGLLPTTRQNPTRQIRLEAQHVPAGVGAQDPQDGSEFEYWQGAGPRTIMDGDFGNRLTLMADTFTTLTPVSFRARTHGTRGGWGPWSAVQTFPLALDPPLAPTNLAPIIQQNRRMSINTSWRHTPNPADWDTQHDSEVEFRQGGQLVLVASGGAFNRLEIPADTFITNETVTFRARTQTVRNGWGPWSGFASFELSSFQSLAPTNLQPTETRNPRMDIPLTWQFNRNPQWFPNDGQTDSEAEVWQNPSQRITINGTGDNRAILLAHTFTELTPVNFRARTYTNLGGWGAWSDVAQIPLAISPPLPPTELYPDLLSRQNPRGIVHVSWQHNPNPEMPADEQTNSEVRFRQLSGAWRTLSGGAENYVNVPAFFFTSYAVVEFQSRTHAAINGWGDWSISERFDLRMTPPFPPTLNSPVNIPVNASNGIFLEWGYNSPYDIFPSRFDIRYRIDGGAWTELHTVSQDDRPAANTATTRSEQSQSVLEWQVRAHGELGDVGEWSAIATAFIVGIPPTPSLVHVTNSNRPEISFSAQGITPNSTSWQLEILHHGQLVYETGKRVFTGVFSHMASRFLANGNYLARLRIANEYGLQSNWAELAFSIATTPPEAVQLRTANNLDYRAQLRFSSIFTGYIYRAELGSEHFIPIAKLHDAESFEDWTVRPLQRYKYFIRTVSGDYSFADSNVATAKAEFLETTIAIADTPHDMVMLLHQLNSDPTKNSHFQPEKTLTRLAGRKDPVFQSGLHANRENSLAFYVSLAGRDRLEALAQSKKTLIMRDWRLGVVYGTITGGVRAQGDGFSAHCHVSFGFTKTDYRQKVDI